MARRKSFLNELARLSRKAERERNKRIKAEERAAREVERARQQAQKLQEQAQRLHERSLKEHERSLKEKEKAQRNYYLEQRAALVDAQNEELNAELDRLSNLLLETLDVDDYIDLDTLKRKFTLSPFSPPSSLATPIPEPRRPELPTLSSIQSLIPGKRSQHQKLVAQLEDEYKRRFAAYSQKEAQRKVTLENLKKDHQEKLEAMRQEVEEHNRAIDQLKDDLSKGEPEAIINYFTLVLESSVYPEDFPQHARLAYVPESKQLVIEYDLPTLENMPDVLEYKYIKTRDEITSKPLPATRRKALYASVIAQISLRTIHEVFEADRTEHIDTVVFNGHVETIDPATGQAIRPCLVTVRTTRDVFSVLDLSRVDPTACLKRLNASVSSKPEELAPVRPVVEFNMVDARFVEETDVLSGLDQRTNLMELTPFEFENLITNLFQKMGLETRQTQSSRDGGVDCVAFDPRPIFGGKVIIQAKRYKHTVGVSAVRDLFGTLQNEGASKGILVTTSGYGKAAYEFADGKPLELLDGSNLLYLLSEHAGIEAKILPPEDWKDPQPDAN